MPYVLFSWWHFTAISEVSTSNAPRYTHSCSCGQALLLLSIIREVRLFSILGNYVNEITLSSAGYIYSRCTVWQKQLHRSVSAALPEQKQHVFSVPAQASNFMLLLCIFKLTCSSLMIKPTEIIFLLGNCANVSHRCLWTWHAFRPLHSHSKFWSERPPSTLHLNNM